MITLMGKKIAKKGLVFMHCGPAQECETCRFKGTCVDSLKEGRMYIIRNIKDSEQNCPIHDGRKVKVVEVEEADINALVDSKGAFEGSMLSFKPPECDVDCKARNLCFPEGLYLGDKCKIVKNSGKSHINCSKGYDLSKVILKY
jgi:uncharacterized protein (UPF0179 family)